MAIRRASLILPCSSLDDLPTHLAGNEAADLLAAWTALWHPALVAACGTLPVWHPAENPPDPAELEGELVVVPTSSRQRLAGDWCDRLRDTDPQNPAPVEARASRRQTLAAVLQSAAVDLHAVEAELVADFLALGHAHLQVELLTRAMRYSSVLDTEQFTDATVAAARAAVAADRELARTELTRAFDLLTDARNHVYSVDFYVVDLTLLSSSTLGRPLRAKLAEGFPTSLLLPGELLDEMARDHPDSLAELRRALEAGIACPVGGMFHDTGANFPSPESLLAEIERGQQAAQAHLGREFSIYGQFASVFPARLPEVLHGTGFVGALYAAFDGGRLPKADQCKTWWGSGEAASIQALAATPLDAARPETWLRLAERIGDTIAHDHVATVLLAGWPGAASEYFDDLRRAAQYGPLLGKLVTLEEYFRVTREVDEWTTLNPRKSSEPQQTASGKNPVSTRVAMCRQDVYRVYDQLATGVAAAAGVPLQPAEVNDAARAIAMNPWNFARSLLLGDDVLSVDDSPNLPPRGREQPHLLPNVPGCGFATLAAAVNPPAEPLADGFVLRNERLELTVSEATGGIQSLRAHRDRRTRLSQRLVAHEAGADPTRMIAEKIEITRNDAWIGQITSRGQLLSPTGERLARFTQTVRLALGMPAAVIDVEVEPERPPSGDLWKSYFASRIAWLDDAIAFRRGVQWVGQDIGRERIDSSEWVEVQDGVGKVTCYGLGLPFHRQAAPTWLDTLLLVAGETGRRFQFALGIDDAYPAQTALGLLTAGRTHLAGLPAPPHAPTGWFLHVGAKNLLLTHAAPLAAPRCGVRLRVLETAGHDTHAKLAAFRPVRAARTTDFRGQPTGVLSVSDGRVAFHVGPLRWIQLEAEW